MSMSHATERSVRRERRVRKYSWPGAGSGAVTPAIAVLAAATLAPGAPGQDGPLVPLPRPPASYEPTPLPEGFDPVRLGLEAEPTTFKSLGLTLHRPAGSLFHTERTQLGVSVVLKEKEDRPVWSVRIQRLASTLASPTAAGQVEDHLNRLERGGAAYTVIDNRPVEHRGVPGHLCTLRQEGVDGQAYVSGWVIMQTGPAGFLVFSLATLPDQLARVQPLLEASYETMTVLSEQQLAAARTALLAAGQVYLDGLDETRLRPLLGLDEWYRMYRNTDQGAAEEIGYSLLRITEAPQGSLNPERPAHTYTATERQVGLLVEMRSRMVVDAARNHYVDVLGLFWMAWDQSAESWSLKATARRSEREQSTAETGLRPAPAARQPRPPLTVIRSTTGSFSRTPFEWSVPQGIYLSQALGWLLGRLPPAAMVDDMAEISTYGYDSTGDKPNLSLRSDTWAALPGGGWEHGRKLGSSEIPARTTFDAEGRFVRSVSADGGLIEAIEPERLRRLWQSKGLRLGRER